MLTVRCLQVEPSVDRRIPMLVCSVVAFGPGSLRTGSEGSTEQRATSDS